MEPRIKPTLFFPSRAYVFAYIAQISVAFILALFAYWEFWPYDVFRFAGPIKLSVDRAVPGQIVEYEMNYCQAARADNVTAEVQLVYSNHLLHYTPFERESLPSGCGMSNVFIQVPQLPPGEYKIYMYREYAVNPLRLVKVTGESTSFEILPSPPPAALNK